MNGTAVPCMPYGKRLRVVVLFLVAVPILAISATAALAQRSMCQVFARSSASHASTLVRSYLNDFDDDIVNVCPAGRKTEYIASGAVARRGRYCQYPVYELTVSKTTPSRLERAIRPPSNNFLITDNPCPSRNTGNYIDIAQLDLDVAERLMKEWRNAISSREAFERSMIFRVDERVSHSILNLVAHGRNGDLAIRRIFVEGGITDGWIQSYKLDVRDPDHPDDGGYRVSIEKLFGAFYHISQIDQFLY